MLGLPTSNRATFSHQLITLVITILLQLFKTDYTCVDVDIQFYIYNINNILLTNIFKYIKVEKGAAMDLNRKWLLSECLDMNYCILLIFFLFLSQRVWIVIYTVYARKFTMQETKYTIYALFTYHTILFIYLKIILL